MAKKQKEITNPKTNEKIKPTKDVLLYGLSTDETNVILKEIPYNYIRVLDCTDCFTDIIALPYIAVVINPDLLVEENIDYFNYMAESLLYFPEKIIFTKPHPILSTLSSNVKYTILNGVIEIKANFKYLILDAIKTSNRSANYSSTISQTIRILSEIRKNAYITTAELSKIIERSPKTVLRYITTLNCAGEFIEYDKSKKGWFLYDNKSLLWGDY